MLHHTFLLGFPSERVIHVIKLFFWRRYRGFEEGFSNYQVFRQHATIFFLAPLPGIWKLQLGEFHTYFHFTLLLPCLVYFFSLFWPFVCCKTEKHNNNNNNNKNPATSLFLFCLVSCFYIVEMGSSELPLPKGALANDMFASDSIFRFASNRHFPTSEGRSLLHLTWFPTARSFSL